MTIYERLLGNPFVFNYIRPFFMGGLDFSKAYDYLECGPGDIILDVGCGMGDALNYFKGFREYHGFDTDKRAIDNFEKKGMKNVFVYNKRAEKGDIERIRPNKCILLGLIHHVTDKGALSLLNALSGVERVSTLDAVYCENKPFSNLLAFLDRGRNTKTRDGYRQLIAKTPFYIFREEYYIPSKRGWGMCYIMDLRPKTKSQ